ncbi:hypothetical protein LSTR_LSTR005663 [Laodelphax striatellus]|uniref:Uncharacterized protein n=1 Tax=Laodelphax striatellus TaxID=195883 RepID=A0A482X7J3_LAOST|nr:hypothetical protein LSTR_LSTR005663 [Laodelphax striatellus]
MDNMRVRSNYRWKEGEGVVRGGRGRGRRKGKQDKEKSFEDDEGNRCREINGDNEKSFEDDRCREIDAPIELDLNAEDYPFDTMLDDSNGAHLETSSSAPDCSAFTLQQTQSAVDLDECDIFGQFIAVKLRKMNPQTRPTT